MSGAKKFSRYTVAALIIIMCCVVLFTMYSFSIRSALNDFSEQLDLPDSMREDLADVSPAYAANDVTVSSFASNTSMGGNERWKGGSDTTKSKRVTATLSGRMAAARGYVRVNYSAKLYDNNITTASDEFFYFYIENAGFSSKEGYDNVDGTKDYSTIYARKDGAKVPTGNAITLYMAVRSGSFFNSIDSGFDNITFIMEKAETAGPTYSVSGVTSSKSFTITDSQSGLYSYQVKNSSGSVVNSWTNGSPASRTTSQSVTINGGSGTYTVTAEDNLGNTSSTTITLYLPSLSIQAYYGTSMSTTGGTVNNTSSGGSSQYVFSNQR